MKSQSTMKCMMFYFLLTIVFVSLLSYSESKLKKVKPNNSNKKFPNELVSEDSTPKRVDESRNKIKKPKHKTFNSLDSDADEYKHSKMQANVKNHANQPSHNNHNNHNEHKNQTDHLTTEEDHHKIHFNKTLKNHTHINHTTHSVQTLTPKYTKGISTERQKHEKNKTNSENHTHVSEHSKFVHHENPTHVLSSTHGHKNTTHTEHNTQHITTGTHPNVPVPPLLPIIHNSGEKSTLIKSINNTTTTSTSTEPIKLSEQSVIKTALPPNQPSQSVLSNNAIAYSDNSGSEVPPEAIKYEPVEYVQAISPQGRAALYNSKT